MPLEQNVTKFLGTHLGKGSVHEVTKGHCSRPKAEFDHSSDRALVESRISLVSEWGIFNVNNKKG
jgi:hypothetical protein